MASNVWRSIFQTFNPFKKGMQDQLQTQREVDRGEVEVDSYYKTIPSALRGEEDENIFAVYLASLKIGDYRDKIYDNLTSIRSNYLVQSVLDIMTDDCLKPDKSTGNIINIKSGNKDWSKELERLQAKIDFDSTISDITPEILLYGEYAQHIIFEKGTGVIDLEDVYDIKNIVPIYKGGKIKEYLVKSDTTGVAGNALIPETMFGSPFSRAALYKYVYYVRAGKRIRVKATKPAQEMAMITTPNEIERISGNVRIGRSIIPTSLIPLIKSLSTLELILPLVRLLQLDKRSLVGIRFPGITKLDRVQQTVQEYERIINDTFRTANIAATGEFNVQDLIASITKFRIIPLLGEKGCFTGDTEIPMFCGNNVAIKDLVGINSFVVYSYDHENKQIVPGRAHSCRCTIKDAPILKITLDNGKDIRCTYNHRFLMRDGTYKEAQDLIIADSIMPLYTRTKQKDIGLSEVLQSVFDHVEIYQPGVGWTNPRSVAIGIKNVLDTQSKLDAMHMNHKIISIEDAGFEDVYDFTVDVHHNFALSAGVFVHNSIEMQDVPTPEIGNMDDFDYIKKTVFEGIGIPSAYVLGGEGKESLKAYVRYLKKLASIQRSLIVGVRHISTVHLRALGHKALPSDIDVEFANIVSVENLDELEYLDILTSLLRNYWEFIRDMDDVEGPTPGIVNWGEAMTFLYDKMKSFAGSEKFLLKNIEYFKRTGVLPIKTKVSGGVGGSSSDIGGGGAGKFVGGPEEEPEMPSETEPGLTVPAPGAAKRAAEAELYAEPSGEVTG